MLFSSDGLDSLDQYVFNANGQPIPDMASWTYNGLMTIKDNHPEWKTAT